MVSSQDQDVCSEKSEPKPSQETAQSSKSSGSRTSRTEAIILRSRRTGLVNDGLPAMEVKPDGRVQANAFGNAGEAAHLTAYIYPRDEPNRTIVALLAKSTGNFIYSDRDDDVTACREFPDPYSAMWYVEPVDDTYVALKCVATGKYLCCDGKLFPGSTVTSNRDKIKEWEQWVAIRQGRPDAFTSPGQTARAIGAFALAAGALTCAGSLAVPALGFGAAGVAKASAAAGIQSSWYGAFTCGMFSTFQSIGATTSWAPVVKGGAALAAGGEALHHLYNPRGNSDADAVVHLDHSRE